MPRHLSKLSVAIGLSFITMAFSSPSSASWFSNLFGGSGDSGVSTAVGGADPIADIINASQKKCAAGEPGTIGASVQNAVKVHTQIASAVPNVEQLFSIDNPCFSGLTKLNDLSFAIPTIGSIAQAVQGALERYATQKVCTFVREQTALVTNPINKVIGEINTQYSGDVINGMIGTGLSGIDPSLGSQYRMAPASETYRIQTNGLSLEQLTFAVGNNTPTQPFARQSTATLTTGGGDNATPMTAAPPTQEQGNTSSTPNTSTSNIFNIGK